MPLLPFYRVRISDGPHYMARCLTIKVRADSADNARAEALRNWRIRNFKDPRVQWTRKVKG